MVFSNLNSAAGFAVNELNGNLAWSPCLTLSMVFSDLNSAGGFAVNELSGNLAWSQVDFAATCLTLSIVFSAKFMRTENAEAPGGFWRLLEASGGFWRLLEVSGGFWRGYWRLLEAPGGSWRLLEAPRLEGLQTYSPNTSGA